MADIFTKNKFLSLLSLLLLGALPTSFAQRLPTPDALTMEDGLCFRHVSAITQDKDGLMWFGTKNGLSRYDGYRFLNFGKGETADKYFPANEFLENGLHFLNDSILWAVADFQLFSMNINSFEVRRIPGTEGKVAKILRGKNEDYWLVSNNDVEQFLWHFTEKKGFEKVSTAPHFRLHSTDVNMDTLGQVWWSTVTKGLQKYSPTGELLAETKIDSFLWYGSTLYHNYFFIDSQNRFFVYSMNKKEENEIWQYFPESGEKKVLVGGMKDLLFNASEDSRGNVWLTKEGGLLQLQPDGNLIDYTQATRQVLGFTHAYAIFEDRTNMLWLGTDGGLLKLPVRKQFFDNLFSKKNVDWGNAMRGICEDQKGDLFFFCEIGDKGLYRSSEESEQPEKLRLGLDDATYDTKLELANYFVSDPQRNCLWTMTESLLKIDLENQKIEAQPAISFGREVSSFNPLALLPDGQILVGNTLDKLALFDPEKGRAKNLFVDKTQEYGKVIPQVFLVHWSDSLWVGTKDNGLYLFNRKGDLLQHYHTASEPSLNNDHVLCLYLDEGGDLLWIGTFGGGMSSIQLSTGQVRAFIRQDGLPNKNVASILGDGDNLWLGTYNGLSCFNKKEETFQTFYEEDGLTNNEFNFTSACKSEDGTMYFGGLNGINSFHPQDLLQKELNPPLVLTRFSQYDQRKDSFFESKLDGGTERPILISPNISYFQFEWTLPNYFNPEKNQYFTWLEGLEEDWTFLGNTPSIRFNKLPPGDYILHVKGKDSRGNWSEKPIELKISVLRPWWERWWAYALYLLLAGGALLFFWRKEARRLKLQNQLEREQLEAAQLRELDEAKTRFFSNLSHEFRTPLTVILGMAEEIKEENSAKKLIRQSGQNLLRLINQTLDFSKLEAGKLTLNLQSGDLVHYLQYIVESFHSLASHKNVQLVFEPEVPTLEMDFDEEKMQHIVSNLLSNAIKFTPRNGKVTLRLTTDGGQLVPNSLRELTDSSTPSAVIHVSDTGIGIPADHLPRIFERYFQVGDPLSKGAPGTGIGLAFTKELVDLMNGEIKVESAVGVGTTFRVILPLAKSFELGVLSFESKDQPESPSLENSTFQIAAQPTQNPKPKTQNSSLLVIEDNPEVVAYIRTVLQAEYEISVAENGQIGIEKAIEIIPDIVISDVMMPVMDGFAVTQFLKNDERTSHIPIVLLTARGDTSSRLEGLGRGADAYLAKPFDKKELQVRLEKLIELRQKMQARYAQFVPPQTTEDEGLKMEDAFLQKINAAIEANLGEAEFSVNELCEEMNMSRPQLFRKLKALTGKSIIAYLRSVRLHRAKELLQTGRQNITEVAFEVGFKDPLYFSRAFSTAFGFPPTDLLK